MKSGEPFDFIARAESLRRLIASNSERSHGEGVDGFSHASVNFGDEFAPSSTSMLASMPEVLENKGSRLLFYNAHLTETITSYLEIAFDLGCPRVFWGPPLLTPTVNDETYEKALAHVSQLAQEIPEHSPLWLILSIYLNWTLACHLLSSGSYVSIALENVLLAGAAARELELAVLNRDDAARGRKVKSSARRGGHERSQDWSAARLQVLASMQLYIGKGHTVANAARLTHKDGIGKSAEANRKVYNRHNDK
jgi:hypothetical protein